MANERPSWAIKEPRSRRKCLRCGHNYASHIDVACMKIVQRKPRIHCDCRGFIGSKYELRLAKKREKNALKLQAQS